MNILVLFIIWILRVRLGKFADPLIEEIKLGIVPACSGKRCPLKRRKKI